MARLPNAEKSKIEGEKLREYLLSSTHPLGRFKAGFFRRFGYSAEDWEDFELCLREHILSHGAAEVEETPYGRKYVIEGAMGSPSGAVLQVVTVWLILRGQAIPRFVTAGPGELP